MHKFQLHAICLIFILFCVLTISCKKEKGEEEPIPAATPVVPSTDKEHELEFEFENRPYEFIDLESGEKVKLQSNEVKSYYVDKVKSFTENLKMRCLQYKIEFVEADINAGFAPILQTYLVKRSKLN